MPKPTSTLRNRKKKRKVKRSMSKRPFKCDLCRYSTCLQSRMVMHVVRTHLSGKPFSCNLCSFKTSDHEDLKKHLTGHLGNHPFSCRFCDFITPRVTILENHMKMHMREEPYGCDQCNFMTSNQYDLVKHLEKHEGGKVTCFICDHKEVPLEAFTAKRKGCRLCQVHSCESFKLTSLHLCALCQKLCIESWSYQRTTIHLLKNQKLSYTYVDGVLACTICKRSFKSKIGYISHMQAHIRYNNNKCLRNTGALGSIKGYRLMACS